MGRQLQAMEELKRLLLGCLLYFIGLVCDKMCSSSSRRVRFVNKSKSLTTAPAGLLQSLPVPALVWNEVTMDFITHLPVSRGFSVVMVVVDRLTKAAHFGMLASGFTASKVARLFTDIVVKFHGFPSSIVSDRDPIFLSKFWAELFKLSGTSLKHSSAYHPQTDGQTEVVNKGLEQFLRVMTSDSPYKWTDYLGWAEFCYNTSYHSSINMSPFQAMYGPTSGVSSIYSKFHFY